VVIQSDNPEITLNLDNILFVESRDILGSLEDVFGKIEAPYYTSLIDKYTERAIMEGRLRLGDSVYILEAKKNVLPKKEIEKMKAMKGCDASNKFDEEISNDNEAEFSNDETESRIKSCKKRKNSKKPSFPPRCGPDLNSMDACSGRKKGQFGNQSSVPYSSKGTPSR